MVVLVAFLVFLVLAAFAFGLDWANGHYRIHNWSRGHTISVLAMCAVAIAVMTAMYLAYE